jgi:hypothetical protein
MNLKNIIESLLKNRKDFKNISDKNKQKFGFIINRLLSKKYPELAEKLNWKSGDYVTVLNIWWLYLSDKPKNYHSWIWPVSQKNKETKKGFINDIKNKYPYLKTEDVLYLKENFKDFFEEEIKKIEKEKEDYG